LFEQADDDFPVKCPKCFKEFHEKVGRIKSSLRCICPDCGLRMTYQTEEITRVLQNTDNALQDYLRQFKRLRT
jgi:transposase-like protein